MQNSKFKVKNLLIIGFLSVLFLSFAPGLTLAQTPGCNIGGLVECGKDINNNGTVDPSEQCGFCDIFALVSRLLVFVLTCLAPILSGLLVVIGGIYYLAAGQDPQALKDAKNIILAVVFGLVIIFVAWVVLNTFLVGIGVADWTGLDPNTGPGWFQFNCN
jgi:hypothetical protein